MPTKQSTIDNYRPHRFDAPGAPNAGDDMNSYRPWTNAEILDSLAKTNPPRENNLRAAIASVLDEEQAALTAYRDTHCQGDDEVKRHAWTVADARLAEVGVIRRKLAEAGILSALEDLGALARSSLGEK